MQIYAAPTTCRAPAPRAAPDDLNEHRWVLMRSSRARQPACAQQATSAHPRRRHPVHPESVRAGIGLGMVPSYLAREHVAAGSLSCGCCLASAWAPARCISCIRRRSTSRARSAHSPST